MHLIVTSKVNHWQSEVIARLTESTYKLQHNSTNLLTINISLYTILYIHYISSYFIIIFNCFSQILYCIFKFSNICIIYNTYIGFSTFREMFYNVKHFEYVLQWKNHEMVFFKINLVCVFAFCSETDGF